MFHKQLFVFVLIGVFILAMGACSKKQTTEVETSPETEVQEAAPVVEPEVEEVEEAPVEEVEPVKLPVLNDVFFDFDKATLTPDAKSILSSNATQLKDADEMTVTIEGHCDERGTRSYNLALGEKRANAAKDFLVSLGVPASMITTVSYGKDRPFDTGHTEAAWAKNRRAHFVINQ
jgi:peptidoglycan-associated lipoprotein